MIITTTPSIDGKKITEYMGIVSGEAILGANIIKDFTAAISDVVGGRATDYEKDILKAKEIAIREMVDAAKKAGADAVIGVDLDFETVGTKGTMLMVSASGTAVKFKKN